MQMFLVNRNTAVVAALQVVLTLSAYGQVRVQAPPGVKLERETISVLIDASCRVVSEELGLPNASDVRVPITLNLEGGDKVVVGNETNGVFTIYLSRWDETQFGSAVSCIALQHLLSRDRKARIVCESLHYAHRASPVISGLTTGGRGHTSSGPDSGTLSHDASFPSEERRFPKLSQFLQMNEEDPEPVSSVCQPRDRSAP